MRMGAEADRVKETFALSPSCRPSRLCQGGAGWGHVSLTVPFTDLGNAEEPRSRR